jgi:hypothetical protein
MKAGVLRAVLVIALALPTGAAGQTRNSSVRQVPGPATMSTPPGFVYWPQLQPRRLRTSRIGGAGLYTPFWFSDQKVPDDSINDQPKRPSPPSPARAQPESSSIQPLHLSVPPRSLKPSASGTLRLEVSPDTAQVYVDGFYAGTVEDAAHSRGVLTMAAGWHRIEFRAPGYETLAANVTIVPDATVSYRGDLKPLRP